MVVRKIPVQTKMLLNDLCEIVHTTTHSSSNRVPLLCAILSFLCMIQLSYSAQDNNSKSSPKLTDLSLEELMNLKITSVSKKPETISEAAAAIFVITQEDLRRSGVTTIPEALRMVPGVQVARIDANKWAVTVRGFNDRFANKLLVLIDGRVVYTPLFSGVYWSDQDVLFEDVERIEVIRGPGASLWGANAVNGVINIITKHSKDTQGGLVTLGTGTEENGVSAFRYGGALGDNTFYRFFTKYLNQDDFVNSMDHDTADEWDRVQGGFRMDSRLSSQDTLMIQSNGFHREGGSTNIIPSFTPPYELLTPSERDTSGFNIMGRWERTFSSESDLALQLYYTWTDVNTMNISEQRHTFDLDFQHRLPLGEDHDFMWGGQYRLTSDTNEDFSFFSFNPPSRELQLFSLFLQDEITLVEDTLDLIVGSKFEHHDYTDFEIQPTARLIWTPNERHTLWGSVSRAVRTPSRAERDAFVNLFVLEPNTLANPLPLPALIRGQGSNDFNSEELLAFETGYRTALSEKLSADIALFYNLYDRLFDGKFGGIEKETTPAYEYFVLPVESSNSSKADSYGVEFALDWNVNPGWTLKPAYTYYQVQYEGLAEIGDLSLDEDNQFHQFSLRSQMNIQQDWEFDLWLRYVDNLPDENIPSYLVLDGRIGWNPKKNIEVALGFQNVFDDRHPEFGESFFIPTQPTEVEHGIYAKITWRF